jgi:uncharacterized membrane protein
VIGAPSPAGTTEARPLLTLTGRQRAALPWVALAIITIAFAVLFSWLSLARHEAFQSHAFDLGNMDQAVWNTLHGRFLRFTDMAVGRQVLSNRLAIHVEPLLILLSPLYLLHSGPQTLLILQAVVVASGAVPAYLLARQAGIDAWWSLVFPLAYLLHPSLQNAVLDDFHAVTLSASLLLWALYLAYRGDTGWFALAAILAALTKEEIGLLVAMLGLLLLYRGRIAAGSRAIAAGVFWFLLCIAVIIPLANPAGRSPYLGRYAYLGHGLADVLLAPLQHPGLVLTTLTSASRLAYLRDILEPTGYTALTALPVLLLALPALLINMLSTDPTMYSGFYQYSAEVVPFAVGAAAIGIGWLSRLTRQRVSWGSWVAPVLCLLVLAGASIDTYRDGFTPLARGYLIPTAGAHQARENQILGLIPTSAVVAAADEIEPHLADRRWIYLLPTIDPTNGPRARYIILDASVPSSPVTPSELHRAALGALRRGFGIVRADDGILLLKKGSHSRRLPLSFYRFALTPDPEAAPERARWGHLTLQASLIHPRDGLVDRARPAAGVETFWNTDGPLPPTIRISLYLSPVYRGNHPSFSAKWHRESASPTLSWLPPTHWPRHHIIRADFVPMQPPPYHSGKVDIVVRVTGNGSAHGIPSTDRVPGSRDAVLLGTLSVDG